MPQPQPSLPNLGAQNLQPSPVTGNNLPLGVMQLPSKGLNGMETGGQYDANRMKAMLAYLSILASTNNLSQQISKQDPNFMPALSNRVYGTSSPVQGTNNAIPVEDWFRDQGMPYSP
jgi:hypothetical protein